MYILALVIVISFSLIGMLTGALCFASPDVRRRLNYKVVTTRSAAITVLLGLLEIAALIAMASVSAEPLHHVTVSTLVVIYLALIGRQVSLVGKKNEYFTRQYGVFLLVVKAAEFVLAWAMFAA